MDSIDNRVSRLLGVRYPIVQAPMGSIARARLAAAVSNAGGLGIIETSSGELDVIREEIRNRFSRPGLRALRTQTSTALKRQEHVGMDVSARAMDLYFGGDMEASIALAAQVVGRIDAIKPVKQIIEETVTGFHATIARLAGSAGGPSAATAQR